MESTLPLLLDKAASLWTDEPYLLGKTAGAYTGWSFSETRDKARYFSAWLLSEGFSPGDRLAILGEGSPEWVAGEFGILGAGMISVPLSPKLTDDELIFRIRHSGARGILVSRIQLARVEALTERGKASDGWKVSGGHNLHIIPLQGGAGTRPGFKEAVDEGRRILDDNNNGQARRLELVRQRIGGHSVAVISYTSGTTGNPKGVMLTHLNFCVNAADSNSLFDNPLKFRTLLILPADHSFTHTVAIFTALTCGVSLYFVDHGAGGLSMLRNIPANLQESQPMFIFTVPTLSSHVMRRILSGVQEKGRLVSRLFNLGMRAAELRMGDWFHKPPTGDRIRAFLPYQLARLLIFPAIRKKAFGDSIRFCVSGGAMLDVRQQKFFAGLGVPMYQGYGLTEAAPVVSSNTPGKHKFGTAGIPAPSIRCRIIDAEGTELPRGKIGEIAVEGASVMKGYYKNEAATREALDAGVLRTGDLGWMDEDGFLILVGRKRALMIAEDGEKFSPEIVEDALVSFTEVFSHVVVHCVYKKSPCALVTVDLPAAKSLIPSQREVSAHSLREAIVGEFRMFQKSGAISGIPTRWIPMTFQILAVPLSESDGTLNSTLKIVRHKVEEVHADAIEYSYSAEGSDPENPRNLAVLDALLRSSG